MTIQSNKHQKVNSDTLQTLVLVFVGFLLIQRSLVALSGKPSGTNNNPSNKNPAL